jgi:hypothetical protein
MTTDLSDVSNWSKWSLLRLKFENEKLKENNLRCHNGKVHQKPQRCRDVPTLAYYTQLPWVTCGGTAGSTFFSPLASNHVRKEKKNTEI